MKKNFKIVGVVLVLILLVLQFIRSEKNEQGYKSIANFEEETQPSVAVKKILESKCYDCHSNHTVYPWYAEVAPFSFWIAHHVEEGKEHFNVSNWKQFDVKKKDHKLEELIEEVEEKEMPLSSYTWLHGDLEEDEKTALINWAKEVRLKYTADN